MKRGWIRSMYLWNIAIQSIVSLLSPIAILCAVAWLLSERLGVGSWIYAVLILLGVLVGLVSMVRFLLGASRALDVLEREHREKEKNQRNQT